MFVKSRLLYIFLGGLLALGLVFGGAAVLAQVDEEAPAEEEQTDEDEAPVLPFIGRRHGHFAFAGEHNEALAEALGISVEELEAAQEEVRVTLIEQAVADGLLTQAQADLLLEQEGAFVPGLARYLAQFDVAIDYDALLAEALGISEEELQAARDEAFAAGLATLVEEGILSEEEAAGILARRAVHNYVDYEALTAAVQDAYEAAIEQALEAGEITQEQADEMLANLESFDLPLPGRGFRFGFFDGAGPRGRGFHHRGGPGFFGGFDGFPAPTDTGLDT